MAEPLCKRIATLARLISGLIKASTKSPDAAMYQGFLVSIKLSASDYRTFKTALPKSSLPNSTNR